MVTTTVTAAALALVGKLLPGAPMAGALNWPTVAVVPGVGERRPAFAVFGNTWFAPDCRSTLRSAQPNG